MHQHSTSHFCGLRNTLTRNGPTGSADGGGGGEPAGLGSERRRRRRFAPVFDQIVDPPVVVIVVGVVVARGRLLPAALVTAAVYSGTASAVWE